MYFTNFKENHQIYYSTFLKSPSLYKQLFRFYDFYNFHSIPITFNDKIYNNFKFEFLQKITYLNLFQTLYNSKDKEFDEFYIEIKRNHEEYFNNEKITISDFKYRYITWKEFNVFFERNSFDEKSIQSFLPDLSKNIKEQKFDYKRYKKLFKQTKKEIILACFSSIFSRKDDMNYKVLKTEEVIKRNTNN